MLEIGGRAMKSVYRVTVTAFVCLAPQPSFSADSGLITKESKNSVGDCKRNIEMTPLCNIEVTLPRVLGSREERRGGGVDEQAGVQPS
jgi:hypothetical protein